MSDLNGFVLSELPPAARVLEVGCGGGELARALDGAGHDVLAIDPKAPEGAIFRAVTLEELEEPGPFDAVVASSSLHHVADLAKAIDRIASLLRPRGRLILDEFAWDRLDEATADWYYGQRRALAAAGQLEPAPPSLEECRSDWELEHRDLHGYSAMRAELDRCFVERKLEWRPYLYHDLGGVSSEPLESSLIKAQAIQALGFRYVGELASSSEMPG